MNQPADAKTLVVVVSKDSERGPLANSIERMGDGSPFAFEFVGNNKRNLTQVYNEFLDRGGYDTIMFFHADVDVDIQHLAAHVERCWGQFDLMGLCGCEKISVSESPLNWFCGSRKFPEGRWGSVCHGELGNTTSFFNADRPTLEEHQVCCIDGLCIIFTRRAIESGLRFDESLRFNCYDTQISLDACMKHGLRVGCLVEPSLKHFSVGRSILGNDFLEDEISLRKRFGLDIPPGSRLAKYIDDKNKV